MLQKLGSLWLSELGKTAANMDASFETGSYQGSFQDLTECWKIQMFLESTAEVMEVLNW